MAEPLNKKMGEVSLDSGRTKFGKEMLKHFLFDPSYKNLNQGTCRRSIWSSVHINIKSTGSFGSFPQIVRQTQRGFQEACELAPDPFIRYKYPKLLDESRAAIANVLNAPLSGVVFVPNATTGVNTVIRNIVWDSDGKDEILYFWYVPPAFLSDLFSDSYQYSLWFLCKEY